MPNSSRVGGIAVSCLTLAGVIGCQILGVKRSDDTNAQPERSPDAGAGARAAPDVAFLAEFNMRMPDELMNNTRTRDAARACAVAINNALSAGRQCDSWNGMAKGVEAGTAAAAIASTAMSSQVSPVAKQHWVWAAIGLGAAFGVMSQVDTWLNCSDRTFRQAQLAALRISHLLNAAHLGSCARHTTEQSRLPAAEAIAAQALDAGASRDLIRQALTGTPAEAVAALREAEKQSNASEATKKQAADAIPSIKEKKPTAPMGADGGVALTYEFIPQPAECIERKDDGSPITLEADRLWDRVNRELVLCWTISATPYGVFSANPNAAR